MLAVIPLHEIPTQETLLIVGREGENNDWVITPRYILQQLYKNLGYYFQNFDRLRPRKGEEITIMHDTKESKYLYYNNCIIRVSATTVEQWDYNNVDEELARIGEENGKYVWKDSIINRDFTTPTFAIQESFIDRGKHIGCVSDEDILPYAEGDWTSFCKIISGVGAGLDPTHKRPAYLTDGLTKGELSGRLESLMSTFGYLMHNNFECNLKSVLYIDVNKSHGGESNGGTGKGMIGTALSLMLNRRPKADIKYISIPGKQFDQDSSTRYAAADIDTQLIHIEDIRGNVNEEGKKDSKAFNFVNFFNDVTDGASFRKLYQNGSRHMVKFMLSTNTPISAMGESVKRRLVVYELNNFFNKSRTPVDVFGHRLLESNWDKEEWQRFDNFMVGCCAVYMSTKDQRDSNGHLKGVIEPPSITYKQQQLDALLSRDFQVWFADTIHDAYMNLEYTEFVKTKLFEDFTHKYKEYDNTSMYQRAFTKWCKTYLKIMEIPSGEKRSTQDLLILYPPRDVDDPRIDYIVR